MLLASVFFSIFLHISIAEQSSLTKIYKFPEPHIETSWPLAGNQNLIYARCNSSHEPGGSKGCILGLQSDAFENSTGSTKECNITLKPEMTNAMVKDSLLLYGFGEDKILIVWVEIQNASMAENLIGWTILKTSVVHVSNSCQTYEAKVYEYIGQPISNIEDRCRYVSVAVFKNTYELILKDGIKECKSESQCIYGYAVYKFDSYGSKLSEPEHWPDFSLANAVRHITSAELRQPKEAYFIDTANCTSLVAELLDKQDHKKLEIWKMSSNESFKGYRYSMANEAIGFGYVLENSSIGVWQADQNGEILISAQLTFQNSHMASLPFIYNLRNGGLLFAIKNKYANETEKHRHDHYDLMKIDATGELKTVKVYFDNKCSHVVNLEIIRMFENKEDQSCMVRLCQSYSQKSGRLVTSVRCYSNDEFSECIECL